MSTVTSSSPSVRALTVAGNPKRSMSPRVKASANSACSSSDTSDDTASSSSPLELDSGLAALAAAVAPCGFFLRRRLRDPDPDAERSPPAGRAPAGRSSISSAGPSSPVWAAGGRLRAGRPPPVRSVAGRSAGLRSGRGARAARSPASPPLLRSRSRSRAPPRRRRSGFSRDSGFTRALIRAGEPPPSRLRKPRLDSSSTSYSMSPSSTPSSSRAASTASATVFPVVTIHSIGRLPLRLSAFLLGPGL